LQITAGAVTMSTMADELEEIVELDAADVVEENTLPAVVEARVVERRAPLAPAVQAVAAAATGFVAGAVALALVRRQTERRLARVQRRAMTGWRPGGEWSTRTYLVHVHMLGRQAE
jgi:hypothetical protein